MIKPLVIAILVLLIGCAPAPGDQGDNLTWAILRSPATGRCYDAAWRKLGGHTGILALGSEVPCPPELSQ